MIRKLLYPLLSIMLVLLCAFSAYAYNADLPRINDGADLLSASEEEELQQLIDEIYGLGYDAVLLTMNSGYEGYGVSSFADNYYDNNGYGCGEDDSGFLFLVNMQERDLYISTCGKGRYVLTNSEVNSLLDNVAGYFSDGDYALGYSVFLKTVISNINVYNNAVSQFPDEYPEYEYPDEYYPGYNDQNEPPELFTLDTLAVCCVAGFGISLIIMLFVRHGMNTARISTTAQYAVKKETFSLSKRSDLFLYSRTRHIPRSDNSSSGSRGSSGGMRSSGGGGRHGGGGRKF